MNYTLFAVKDNAEAQLDSGIGAATLSIILKSGKGALFPQPYSGTASSAGTSVTLNKTGIGASGIAVGDFIENTTDGSHAFVLTVSTDSLTTTALQGGSDNLFENGDAYIVNPFIVTLNKRDSLGQITSYEKVKIIGRSGDSLTVDPSGRGYDGSTAQGFVADDYCDVFVISKQYSEIKKAFAEVAEQLDLKASILYVQASMNARTWKMPVVCATTTAGTLASSFENGDTVDGVVLATGDRILIKNQTSPIENGIYTVNASGAPTRATDFDSPSEVTGAGISIIKGTSNADTVWICTSDSPSIGVDNITFSQVGATLTKANLAEAQAGTDDTKYITSSLLANATNRRILTAAVDLAASQAIAINSSGQAAKPTSAVSTPTFSPVTVSGTFTDSAVALDPTSGKLVAIFRNSTTSIQYSIGTIASGGGSISWSAAATLISVSSVASTLSIIYDTQNSCFIVSYGQTSTGGSSVACTLSGSTLTAGTPVAFATTTQCENVVSVSIGGGKFVVHFSQTAGYNKGIVGSVSGTTITFGSVLTIGSNNVFNGHGLGVAWDSVNSKLLFVAEPSVSSTNLLSWVGTESSSTLSVGTAVSYNAGNQSYDPGSISISYDSYSGCMIIFYEQRSGASSNWAASVVAGKISGTTISYGSKTDVISYSNNYWNTGGLCVQANPGLQKIYLGFVEPGSSHYKYYVATINTSTYAITLNTLYDAIASIGQLYNNAVYVPQYALVVTTYVTSSVFYAAQVTMNGNYSSASLVDGIVQSTVAAAGTAPVSLLFSTVPGFTGKTPGATAYLWSDGTIQTSYGDTTQKIGKFISATELLLARSL